MNEDTLAAAIKKAFTDRKKSPILVSANVDRICDDIRKIHQNIEDAKGEREEQSNDIRDIKYTLWWLSRIMSVTMPIILGVLGYFAIQTIDSKVQVAADEAQLHLIVKTLNAH